MNYCGNILYLGEAVHEVHDHLGNVRQVYGDARYFGTGGSNAEAGLTLKEQTSYYPFGMQIATLSYSREDYTFGMQGMIRDDEMKGAGNSISFKYRDYDFDCLFASSCVLYQSGAIRFRYKQRPETDGNENCNR